MAAEQASNRTSENSKRTYSLDLLRIVAMFMIIVLHFLSKGWILTTYPVGSLGYDATRVVESVCVVAVNCYVLLSGYFLIHSRFKIKRLFELVLQTVFYSLGIYLLFMSIGLAKFTPVDMFSAALPILSGVYWFMTIYVGLYLLSPFLNKLLLGIDRRTHLALIVILIALFSAWPTLFAWGNGFTYMGLNIANGYSVIWFIVLYCIAAYIRQYYRPSYKIGSHLKRYVITAVVIAPLYVVVDSLGAVPTNTYFVTLTDQLYGYNSLPVLVASFFLFMVFLNLRIKRAGINKAISILSPMTLSVYLIHEEPHLRVWLWSTLNPPHHAYHSRFLLYALAAIVSIYVACSAIDWLRIQLFDFIGGTRIFQEMSVKFVASVEAAIDRTAQIARRIIAY